MTPKLIRYESPAGPYWYHPDHPLCQDGNVLHEEPEEPESMDTEERLRKAIELLESAIMDFEKLKPWLGDAAPATAQLYRDELNAIKP